MKLLAFILMLAGVVLNTPKALAQNTFQITQPGAGYGISVTTDLSFLLQNVIIIFFTVGGIGFIMMILWGAVDWILSGGDKEKIAGARRRIITAITGLTVLALSFVIITIAGQILGIEALKGGGIFAIPGLGKQ